MAELDRWIRTDFRTLNTLLEEAYFAAGSDRIGGADVAAAKAHLIAEGSRLSGAIESLPGDPDDRYELLGMVGYVIAACRRHGIDEDQRLDRARAVAQDLGDALGVAPRYIFAHQSLANSATDGMVRTFTTLPDEERFIRLNTLGVLAYERAAQALRPVRAMGISNRACAYLLDDVGSALRDVLAFNQQIRAEVDIQRFSQNIRPYFTSHRVGETMWRGVNAGDFSAINELDVLLGLCDTTDPLYAHVISEKRPFVPPSQQARLDGLFDHRPSLLELALAEAESGGSAWRENAGRLLTAIRAHGAAYAYHHHNLVLPYVQRPALMQPDIGGANVTSSGPPLDDVITTLERLRFLRTATPRPGLRTARPELERLRALL